MHVFRINKPIFEYDEDHPARRFLEAFIKCRKECVGRELEGVDQDWWSDTDNCMRRFSAFAYEHLSFDVELDGWLTNAGKVTASEKAMLQALPYSETLMAECRDAAEADNNHAVIEMCIVVLDMLMLWKQCIEVRFSNIEESEDE